MSAQCVFAAGLGKSRPCNAAEPLPLLPRAGITGRKRTPQLARRSPSRLQQPNASHHHQGQQQQAQELVGTGKLCGLVLEHALTTCGSKAPGDKESKGLLSGDQAQLPLQKSWHSWVVGHSAGHWEQSLSPTWGSSRGAGAACNPHRCILDIRDQPELEAVHSLGQMKWAGQWSHAGTRSTACSPRSAGRAGMGWAGQAVVTAGHSRASRPWVASGCTELAQGHNHSAGRLARAPHLGPRSK